MGGHSEKGVGVGRGIDNAYFQKAVGDEEEEEEEKKKKNGKTDSINFQTKVSPEKKPSKYNVVALPEYLRITLSIVINKYRLVDIANTVNKKISRTCELNAASKRQFTLVMFR